MRLLIDTHGVVWAADNPSQLGANAVALLANKDNDLLVSAASLWELAIKTGTGKLTLSAPYLDWMSAAIFQLKAAVLDITVEHCDAYARLPFHHRDPFDRLLIAQALSEGLTILSNDKAFDQYGVTRVW